MSLVYLAINKYNCLDEDYFDYQRYGNCGASMDVLYWYWHKGGARRYSTPIKFMVFICTVIIGMIFFFFLKKTGEIYRTGQ